MASEILGNLATDLNCVFGTGKAFSAKEEATIPAGTEILSRFQDTESGWHKFAITEYGRRVTYAVQSAAILDTALGATGALTPREQVLIAIRKLMREHGIHSKEL